MIEAVPCPTCGAKNRKGSVTCLRRGGPLAVCDARRELGKGRPRDWLQAAAVLSLIALAPAGRRMVGILWSVPPVPSALARAELPGARHNRTAPAGAGQPPAPSGSFLDSTRAGLLAYRQGNFEAARTSYERAVQEQPLDAESLNNLGQVLVRLDRPAEALICFDRAIAVVPGKWAFRFNRARAFGLTGDWARSVEEYRAASRLFPEDHVTVFNLALALHHSGDEASAVTEFEHATRLAPEEPDFHLALAGSLEKLGRTTEAAREYGRYLSLKPDAPERESLRVRITRLSDLDPRQPGT